MLKYSVYVQKKCLDELDRKLEQTKTKKATLECEFQELQSGQEDTVSSLCWCQCSVDGCAITGGTAGHTTTTTGQETGEA